MVSESTLTLHQNRVRVWVIFLDIRTKEYYPSGDLLERHFVNGTASEFLQYFSLKISSALPVFWEFKELSEPIPGMNQKVIRLSERKEDTSDVV